MRNRSLLLAAMAATLTLLQGCSITDLLGGAGLGGNLLGGLNPAGTSAGPLQGPIGPASLPLQPGTTAGPVASAPGITGAPGLPAAPTATGAIPGATPAGTTPQATPVPGIGIPPSGVAAAPAAPGTTPGLAGTTTAATGAPASTIPQPGPPGIGNI